MADIKTIILITETLRSKKEAMNRHRFPYDKVLELLVSECPGSVFHMATISRAKIKI